MAQGDDEVQVELPYIEVVSRLKRDNERMSATLVSATAALNKCERDATKLAIAKKNLETSVVLLEQQVKTRGTDELGVEAAYRQLQVRGAARLERGRAGICSSLVRCSSFL